MLVIKPCPVCGKLPKVEFDIRGERAIARCKPLLRRAHLVVAICQEWDCPGDHRAEEVIKAWNEKIEKYEDDALDGIW